MVFRLLATALFVTAATLSPNSDPESPPVDPVVLLPAVYEMDLPAHPIPGGVTSGLTNDELVGRMYTLIAPFSVLGPVAVVVYDVPIDGPPVQRAIYETSITGDRSISQQQPAIDPTGRFLFLPGGRDGGIAVYELAQDGTIVEISGSPFTTFQSYELAVHPDGNLLFSSQGLGLVQSFAIAQDGSLTLVGEAEVQSSRGIEVTADGRRLYVAEGFSGARGFDIQPDGTLVELADSPFRNLSFSRPFEIETASDSERLYITDLDAGLFAFTIDATGDLSQVPGSPYPLNSLTRKTRITSDDAYLYATGGSPPRIFGFRVEAEGALTTLSGSPFSGSGIELLEVPERESLISVPRGGFSLIVYDLLDDGTLIQSSESLSLSDAFNRRYNGAAFVSIDLDSPPVADAGASTTVECTGTDGAVVLLDGAGSTDSDSTPGTNDDIVLFEWFSAFDSVDEQNLGEGQLLETTLPIGVSSITLRVTDSTGLEATESVVLTVTDSTPPAVVASFLPLPAGGDDDDSDDDSDDEGSNDRDRFEVGFEVTDVCDPAPDVLVRLDASACGSFPASTGTIVNYAYSNACSSEFEIGSGPIDIESPSLALSISARDGSGNETTAVVPAVSNDGVVQHEWQTESVPPTAPTALDRSSSRPPAR